MKIKEGLKDRIQLVISDLGGWDCDDHAAAVRELRELVESLPEGLHQGWDEGFDAGVKAMQDYAGPNAFRKRRAANPHGTGAGE